jgi:hypothetical protein
MNTDHLTASGIAREIENQLGWEVSPRDITQLFYNRDIPDDQAPIVSGRRMIPVSLIADIANALRSRGWYRQRAEAGQ